MPVPKGCPNVCGIGFCTETMEPPEWDRKRGIYGAWTAMTENNHIRFSK